MEVDLLFQEASAKEFRAIRKLPNVCTLFQIHAHWKILARLESTQKPHVQAFRFPRLLSFLIGTQMVLREILLFPLLLQWFYKDYWVSKLRGSGNACRECRRAGCERRTHKVALRRGVGASQLLDREIQMTWTQNHWKDKTHRNINQL